MTKLFIRPEFLWENQSKKIISLLRFNGKKTFLLVHTKNPKKCEYSE